MAEFIASKLAEAVVSQAVQTIADLLIREASALREVRGDIQRLQKELEYMQSFLKDADSKQGQNDLVRKWIAEVKDVACEIEDAIETYVYKVHSSYIKAFHLRKLRAQINSIKDTLQDIKDRRLMYQIEVRNGDQAAPKDWRRSYPDEEEEDVIMLKSTTAALKDRLISKEDQRRIVSIVGMAGLGKTTLVKKVYNDVDVKKNFDCCAWAFISQQYVAREVLSEILMQIGFQSDGTEKAPVKDTKEFPEERKRKREILKGLTDYDLVRLLNAELSERRYLIVLDDIWNIDAWNNIKNAFPQGKPGSKVVFTTRIMGVASSADDLYGSIIEPSLLTPEESWELLQRKAFPRAHFGECGCPSGFEELGKEMVAKCKGLPLAIVVLGGLLRTKKSLDDWKKVQKDVESRIINKLKIEQHYSVEDILNLSFQELPYSLKSCFLYMGCFPEDSEIPKKRLIRLWIVEGFIPKMEKEDTNGTLMEDIAEEYLGELIGKCMVQVDQKDHTGKKVKTCRLHDLMRDFCLSKAKEESFLQILQQHEMNMMIADSSSVQSPTTARSRRIAVHVNYGLHQSTSGLAEQVHPHLRSLLCFDVHTLPNFIIGQNNFLLLRVLQLDFLTCSILPFRISSLIHLRYLRVSNKDTYSSVKLPQSLGNLQNLQTLDLQGLNVCQLPSTILRLRHLRYLLLPSSYKISRWAIRPFLGSDSLPKLETLKGIDAKDLIRHNSVIAMRNIRVLEIKDLRSPKEVTLVLESLKSHSRLRLLGSLTMKLCNGDGDFPTLKLLSECHVVSRLHLDGALSHENFSFLPKSLTKLALCHSTFNQEKMEVLEQLPNLRVLDLNDDETMNKWVCSVNGFPKLETLMLKRLLNLEEWEVEEGAMPNLKRLHIKVLRNLRMLPEGLKRITTLRELNISAMTRKFVNKFRGPNEDGTEGEDYYKVRHIPSITFSFIRTPTLIRNGIEYF